MDQPVADAIRILDDPEAVAGAAADLVAGAARDAIGARGVFHLALAGGSTPRRLYERMVRRPLDWSRIEIWFGDERAVPPDHEASNFRMACETLLSLVPIPSDAVRRIRGEAGADVAAREYAEAIRGVTLDLVLLGMGGDGHTASLFPDTPDLGSEGSLVVPTFAPAEPRERVSLSLRSINAAREAVFLVTGEGKAAMLGRVLEERRGEAVATRPAALVRPEGRLSWLIDRAAATEIR